MTQGTDVIVVGGGLAGLIAAAEAARAGATVELYERNDALGGRARTRHVDGFAFNQGPHALYREGALRRALDRLGIAVSGNAPSFERALAIEGDRLSLLPFRPAATARTALLDDAGKRALSACLRGFLGEVSPQRGESIAAYLDRLAPPPTVRRVLEALVRVTTYSQAPQRHDAAAAVGQVALGFKGVVYVDGGWGRLTEALGARAAALGVSISASQAPERIDLDAEGATLRFADGGPRSARAVILAVPPADARRLVPDDAALRRADELARPVRSLCLDLGLSRLPAPRRTYALGLTRPLYFSVHSAAAQLAPAGAAMVHVARFLGDDEPFGAADLAELERFMDLIQPGWRELEAARQRLTGIVVAGDYPQAARGGLAGRPTIDASDHRSLFIAGDWVGPEGLLSDAAAASGTAAGRAAAACARRAAA